MIPLLLALSLLGGAAHAAPGTDSLDFRWRHGVDSPILLSTLAYAAASKLFDADRPYLLQAPAALPAWPDKATAGGTETPAPVSDVLLAGAFYGPVLLYGADTLQGLLSTKAEGNACRAARQEASDRRQARRTEACARRRLQTVTQPLVHLGLNGEAIGLSVVANDVVKAAVRRPRPYTHSAAYQAELAEALATGSPVDPDDQYSFYSGHTSTVGTWSFATAHILATEYEAPAWKLAYLGAAGLTAWTGVLRVQAHKHYPTDVLVGGVVGAAFGVVVPELHRLDGVQLSATVGPDGGRGLALSGRW